MLEVRNPGVLLSPLFADLFQRAFADERHAEPMAAQTWLAEHAGNRDLGVLVAAQGGLLSGLLVMTAAVTPFTPLPWVVHIFADGPGVREALTRAGWRWLRERGHTAFWAVNRSARDDVDWTRRFASAGRILPLGTLFEFDGS